jgi:hypothetical protein
MPEPAATEPELWDDLQLLLDQELSGLPHIYRVAIVLCDLEGKTRKEAARQLGVPEGTLAARVARGRVMLAKRLARHGLAVSGGALGMTLSQHAASAHVPISIVSSTIKAASLFAAGQAAATGVITTHVVALAEGVLKSMLLNKLKVAVVVLLAIGAVGIGAAALPYGTAAAEPQTAVSKAAALKGDDGNLKETVLALEKRMWEAYSKQDADTFHNLLPDDFICLDTFGRPSDKAGVLDYVAKFRILEYTMQDVKVILLNATSAIVSYQIDYKVRPTNGQEVESTSRRVTSAWAQRKGKWWDVYYEERLVPKGESPWRLELRDFKLEQGDLSEVLKQLNKEKKPPEEEPQQRQPR